MQRVIQAIAGEEDANGQWYRATDLYYDTSGRLWVSRLQRYQLVEVGDPPQVEIDLDTRQFLAAMEYRYDAGRQRYMVRPRDAETLAPPQDGSGDYDLDIGAWHDYSGAAIYGDYAVEAAWDGEHQTVTAANVTETLAHEPGMVQYDRAAAAGEEQLFLHGNLVGTTERITDAAAAIVHRAVYTAFGEPIFPSPSQGEGQGEGTIPTRYGYVGAWGYEGNPLSTGQALEGPGGLCDPAGPEAHCDPVALLGWLHVGERYYDPAGGRFMQRDPIGIAGGPNVYGYVEDNPADSVDPDGLIRWLVHENDRIGHEAIIVQVGKNWFVRIDYGSYGRSGSGDNVEFRGGPNLCSLLREKDVIKDARGTSIDHDLKTFRKALHKYMNRRYWLLGRNCRNVARKLFNDDPPTLPSR
jgi:RHS repeat-associated protein